MTRKFFGTDGIRGLTNSPPMTADVAFRPILMKTSSTSAIRNHGSAAP